MSTPEHAPPILCLPLGEFQGVDGFEAWNQLVAPLWSTDPLGATERFRAHGQIFQIGAVVFSDVRFGAQRFEHSPRVHQQQELLLLELYHQGQARGLLDNQVTHVGPDRLQLVDFARPYRTVTSEVRTWGVCIPYAAVGYDPARHPVHLTWLADTAETTTLVLALRNLWQALSEARRPAAQLALADLLALVRERLATQADTTDPSAIDAIKGRCIERYIEDHLGDLTLDTDRLCATFACSRATLYRHLKGVGGIESYIRNRRLERCLIELGKTQPARGEINRIATRWGFDNPSYFNRLFVNQFGARPGDWLGYPVIRRRAARPSKEPTDIRLDRLFGQTSDT